MTQGIEWYREQSEYNRRIYEWLQATRPDDAHDWKVAALFYSALHRINYEFARRTGRVPRCHAERNRRARRDLPGVFGDYRDLYMESIRARYCDGFRVTDGRRKSAYERLCGIEKRVPF